MELREVKLKNFRGHEDLCIKFTHGLQMFVGKNDIGKSTILEALDIFFNDKDATAKISIDDFNISAKKRGETVFSITCVFELSNRDELYVETVKINPKSEFLLNKDDLIEITKEWDISVTTLKPTTYILCYIPDNIPIEIITAKQTDLKKKIKELHLEDQANQSINTSMRQAIYAYYIADNADCKSSEKKLPTKNALCEKDIFDNISKSFPDFYLFKADRKNSTSDEEVQNPMTIAVKRAFACEEVVQKVKEIEEIVKTNLDQINSATIEKMQELDIEYGNQLKARIVANWPAAIKNDILDGNEIPINKRGSGIRRLLLLSYLMVEAEKKSFERSRKDIIYAIEEPETALHPFMQKRFINQLIMLSHKNRYEFGEECSSNSDEQNHYQIFITTHLPNYVSYADLDQIIYLYRTVQNKVSRYEDGDIKTFIQSEMGKLPIIDYKFIIFVEGENDVNALLNFGKIPELKEIFDISSPQVQILPLKGSNLLKCIELDYYWNLPIKQYHLYDSDVQKYKEEIIDKRCNLPTNKNIRGTVTKLKEMENYIPRAMLESVLGVDLDHFATQWQNNDFNITNTLLSLPDTTNSQFTKIKNMSGDYKEKEKALKAYLNNTVIKGVSKVLLEQHGVYSEIESWFCAMKELMKYSDD